MREKPRVLEALEDVQQEKKNQERRLRYSYLTKNVKRIDACLEFIIL